MGCVGAWAGGRKCCPQLCSLALPSNLCFLGSLQPLGVLPPPLLPYFSTKSRGYHGGQMSGRRGFLLMINACSLSPSPRCSWSPSLLGWGEHGPASSRGSALDLSNWVRQRGQRLRRGSQAAETRSSRTELDLLGEADLAPVREEKTRPAFREGVMLRMPSAMWGRCQSVWHKSGGTRGRGP